MEPEDIPPGLRQLTSDIEDQYRSILDDLTTKVDGLAKTTVLAEQNEILGTKLSERFQSSSWEKFMGVVDDMKQSSLARLNEINVPIQRAINTYNEQAKGLQAAQEKLASEIEALGKSKESMQDAKKNFDQQFSELKQLQAELNTLKAANSQLASAEDSFNSEKQALQDYRDEADAKVQEAEQKVKELQIERNNLAGKVANLEKTHSSEKDLIETWKKHETQDIRRGLQSEFRDQQDRLRDEMAVLHKDPHIKAVRENSQLGIQMRNMEVELKNLKEEHGRLQGEKTEWESKLQQEVQACKNEAKAASETAERKRQEDVRTERERVNHTINSLTTQMQAFDTHARTVNNNVSATVNNSLAKLQQSLGLLPNALLSQVTPLPQEMRDVLTDFRDLQKLVNEQVVYIKGTAGQAYSIYTSDKLLKESQFYKQLLQISQTAKQTNENVVAAAQEYVRANKETENLGNEYRQKSKRNEELGSEVRQLKALGEQKDKNIKNLQQHHDYCVEHHKDNEELQKLLQKCKDSGKYVEGQYYELENRANGLETKNAELTKATGALGAQLAEAKDAAKTDLGKDLKVANLKAELEQQKLQAKHDHEKQRADNCENARGEYVAKADREKQRAERLEAKDTESQAEIKRQRQRADDCEKDRKTKAAEDEKEHGQQLASVYKELAEHYEGERRKDQDETEAQKKRADDCEQEGVRLGELLKTWSRKAMDCEKERKEDKNRIANLEAALRMYTGTPAQPAEPQPTEGAGQTTGGRPTTTSLNRWPSGSHIKPPKGDSRLPKSTRAQMGGSGLSPGQPEPKKPRTGKGPGGTLGEDPTSEEDTDLYGSPQRTVRGPKRTIMGTIKEKIRPTKKPIMGVSYDAPTGEERPASSGADAPAPDNRGVTPTEQRRSSGFRELASSLSPRRLISGGGSSIFDRLITGGESRQAQTEAPPQRPTAPQQPAPAQQPEQAGGSQASLGRRSVSTLRPQGSQASLGSTTASTRATRGEKIFDALEQPPQMTPEQEEELRRFVLGANLDLSRVLDQNAEFPPEQKRCVRAHHHKKLLTVKDGKCAECKARNHKLCFSVEGFTSEGAKAGDSEYRGEALKRRRKAGEEFKVDENGKRWRILVVEDQDEEEEEFIEEPDQPEDPLRRERDDDDDAAPGAQQVMV